MSHHLEKEIKTLKKAMALLEQDAMTKDHALMGLKQKNDIQQTIVRILEISLLPISLNDQMTRILKLLLEIDWLTLTKKGAVFIVEKSNVLSLVAEVGLSQSLLTMCSQVAFGRCLCGKAAQTKEIVFKSCIDDEHHNRPEGMVPHGHYTLPIILRDKVVGVLNLYVEHGHQSTAIERRFLHAVTNAIASIIERKKLEESLTKLSLTDPLTDLPNRRKVFDDVHKSMARAKRNNNSIAIFFVDLDKFKPINDGYGHDCGDKVLQVIADRFKQLLRTNDSVGRIGGDEFLVIADNVGSHQAALLIVDRIKKKTCRPMILNSLEIQIDCSVGFSIYPNDSRQLSELIEIADNNMYMDKKSKE